MPPQEQRKISAPAKPSLLKRVFGSSEMTPQMQEGIKIAQQENPNLAPVQPYGFLSRLLSTGEQGYTSPGRNIYLNPKTMKGQNPQDVADTISHEQTHVDQMKQRGYGPTRELLSTIFGGSKEPYHRRPDEMEAFQVERARRTKMGRSQSAIPSFLTGEFRTPQDIYLPREK